MGAGNSIEAFVVGAIAAGILFIIKSIIDRKRDDKHNY